jgi:phosphonate degradation associated HDIG domain protein
MSDALPETTNGDPLAAVEGLFARRGRQIYGEAVTQLEHALQCAHTAERQGASDALITAALLHDVGHMLHADAGQAFAAGVDDRHEALGAQWLARWFVDEVTRPIAMHVAAKRYLVRVDPHYAATLSPVSRRTLELQGGAMSDREAATFAGARFMPAAVQVRRWDEVGKVPGRPTPTLRHFLAIASRCLR